MFIYLEGCDRNDENARDLEGGEVDGDRSEVRGDESDLEDSRDLEGRKIVGFELVGGRSEDGPRPPRRGRPRRSRGWSRPRGPRARQRRDEFCLMARKK